MNTPNKLTIGRIIATPFFMAALMIDFPFHYTAALILFISATRTDMIFGKIGRKYNIITELGKFLDTHADKMHNTAAFLGFIKMGIGWQVTWIAFIVLFREFLISSLRLVVVSSGGKVIAANMWGKCKTVSQMAGIIFALFCYVLIGDFNIGNTAFVTGCNIIISILFWVSAVLCIISGVIYLLDSREFVDPTK